MFDIAAWAQVWLAMVAAMLGDKMGRQGDGASKQPQLHALSGLMHWQNSLRHPPHCICTIAPSPILLMNFAILCPLLYGVLTKLIVINQAV